MQGGDGHPKKLSGIAEDNYVNGVVVRLRAKKISKSKSVCRRCNCQTCS